MTEPTSTTDTPPRRPEEVFDADDYRHFYEESGVPTLTLDLKARRVIECNRATEQALGLPKEEIIGRSGADLLAEATPDQVLRLRGLRGDATRTIRSVRTVTGPRICEILIVPAGDGVVFVQALDLTEVLTANAALEQRTRELNAKSAALENVSTRMAHDLRGPLATIGGLVELLGMNVDSLPDDRRAAMLDRIGANVRSLSQMIGGLLDQAVAGGEADTSSRRVVDLFSALNDIFDVDLFAIDAALRTRTTVDSLPFPNAEIQQALVNLIGNAVKFRDPGRKLVIDLDIEAVAGELVFAVTDNGTGIPDNVADLFAEGTRGDNSSGVGGVGLGLAFVRQAALDLGGTVSATGNETGSTFRITVPLAPVDGDDTTPTFGGTYASGLTGAQLSHIIDTMPVPTLLTDLSVRAVVRVNDAMLAFLGIQREDILGRRASEFLVDPAVGDALRSEAIKEDSGATRRAMVIMTADGPRNVELHLATIPDTTLAIAQLNKLD